MDIQFAAFHKKSIFLSKEKRNVAGSQEPDSQSFRFYFQVRVRVDPYFG